MVYTWYIAYIVKNVHGLRYSRYQSSSYFPKPLISQPSMKSYTIKEKVKGHVYGTCTRPYYFYLNFFWFSSSAPRSDHCAVWQLKMCFSGKGNAKSTVLKAIGAIRVWVKWEIVIQAFNEQLQSILEPSLVKTRILKVKYNLICFIFQNSIYSCLSICKSLSTFTCFNQISGQLISFFHHLS